MLWDKVSWQFYFEVWGAFLSSFTNRGLLHKNLALGEGLRAGKEENSEDQIWKNNFRRKQNLKDTKITKQWIWKWRTNSEDEN